MLASAMKVACWACNVADMAMRGEVSREKGRQYTVDLPWGVYCTWLEDDESLRSICYIASGGINIRMLEEKEERMPRW